MSGVVKELYDEQALLQLVSELRRGNDVRLSCVMRLEALEASTDESFQLNVNQGDFGRGSCQIDVSRATYIAGVVRSLFRIEKNIAAKTREIDAFMAAVRERFTNVAQVYPPKENADG